MSIVPLSRSGRSAFEVATQAVKEAGETMIARLQQVRSVQEKGRANIVTDVDLEVERGMVALLRREYPDWGLLTEESAWAASPGDSPYTWLIDPLDGTNNYARAIPFFSVVLSLARGEEILLAMVYNPVKGELFWARRGEGSFLNDRPVSVSRKESLEASVIGFDMGYDAERAKRVLALINDLWPGVQAIRVMGSSALGLAHAACGRLDLYFHPLLYPWELGVGLLLTEAGGVISNWEGGALGLQEGGAIASNARIHQEFLKLIKDT